MAEELSTRVIQAQLSTPTLVLGAAIALIGLVLLIVLITLLSRLVKAMEHGKGGAPGPVAPYVPQLAVQGVEPQVVAAITAALLQMEGGGKQLVVRSVRKSSAWSDAGKRESINF